MAKAVTAGAAKAIPDLPRRPGARLQLQINPSPGRFLDRLRNSEHRSAGSTQEYEIKEVREPVQRQDARTFTHYYAEVWKPYLVSFMETLGPVAAAR